MTAHDTAHRRLFAREATPRYPAGSVFNPLRMPVLPKWRVLLDRWMGRCR